MQRRHGLSWYFLHFQFHYRSSVGASQLWRWPIFFHLISDHAARRAQRRANLLHRRQWYFLEEWRKTAGSRPTGRFPLGENGGCRLTPCLSHVFAAEDRNSAIWDIWVSNWPKFKDSDRNSILSNVRLSQTGFLTESGIW